MAEQQQQQPVKAAAPAKPTNTDQSELAHLRQENARLRDQLAAAGGRVQQPEHTFVLSEGARQELATQGFTNVDGVRRTAAEVEDMLGDDQQNVDLGDAEPTDGLGDETAEERAETRPAIRGFDYVYPSVEPGFIDPAVAGLPGINGPSADTKPSSARK